MSAAPANAMMASHADNNESSNQSKMSLIYMLTLLIIMGMARQVLPLMGYNAMSSDNSMVSKSEQYKPLIATSDQSSSSLRPTTATTSTASQLSPSSLPIYLLQSATNQTAQTSWGDLATQWNRTTQYNDLFQQAAPVPSLPKAQQRPVVMIHCGPKTGSTTLRLACKTTLEQTCGISQTPGIKPLGYMDETKLYPLIERCTNTSHFCAKEITMPLDIPTFKVDFIHMFPFRNYDDWAKSALKQRYDKQACTHAKQLLDECSPSSHEIDFRKYGKTQLSTFKELVVQRMIDRHESHIFVLYHHRELNEVMEKLSNVYDVPWLPGSDGKGNVVRPEGTCDDSLLQQFHDCFSSELMELT
jgi:hypothetical protein